MKKLRDILEKNETVVYKTPERTPPPAKNWVQSMFRGLYGEPKAEVKPVTPLPQFDKAQSAMPDMDTMVGSERQKTETKIGDTGIRKPTSSFVSKPEPKVGSLVAPQSGYPAAEKLKAPIPKPKPEQEVKIVSKGDTLWDIAGGDPKEVKRLRQLNPKLTPSKMPIGYKLKLK